MTVTVLLFVLGAGPMRRSRTVAEQRVLAHIKDQWVSATVVKRRFGFRLVRYFILHEGADYCWQTFWRAVKADA